LLKAIKRLCDGVKNIQCICLEKNYGIANNTSKGVAVATGDFLCFLDHDDTLEPDALFEYAKALVDKPDTDVIYCDEDIVAEDGSPRYPIFKSDFSLDMLHAKNYITHFLAIRTTLYKELGAGNSKYDGAQDYDLCLRAVEKTKNIHHVSRVLYHWRESSDSTANNPESKSYAAEAGKNALQAHMERCGIDAVVSYDKEPFTYVANYCFDDEQSNPLISIIIPSKDNSAMLSCCLNSILKKSSYTNYEIIVIENNSTEAATFAYYETLESYQQIKLVTWTGIWDYSEINNFGTKYASGEYLLFLNNDTEIISENWLEQMLGIAMREEVGAVGAKLYYPDDTIQHAGVFFSENGPGHLFQNYPKDAESYSNLKDLPQKLSAVTAACMLTKRKCFEELKGFNKDFPVAYNDVDYCLRLQAAGYQTVYTPYATLYHYESASRGHEITPKKRIRFVRDMGLLMHSWPEYFVKKDPCVNPNINKNSSNYQIEYERTYLRCLQQGE
jgi:GT2 family glycosyltransferase